MRRKKISIARNGRALPGQIPGVYPQGELINKGLPGVGEGLKEDTRASRMKAAYKKASAERHCNLLDRQLAKAW